MYTIPTFMVCSDGLARLYRSNAIEVTIRTPTLQCFIHCSYSIGRRWMQRVVSRITKS